MSWRYSVLEHDEVWVEDEERTYVCVDCGEMVWDDEVRFDDDEPFCDGCYHDIFGS